MDSNTIVRRSAYKTPELRQTIIAITRVYCGSYWNSAEIDGEFQDIYGGEL